MLIDALLEAFKNNPPSNSIEFVAFAAEEEGLFGSKAYVDQSTTEIVGMINLDTIGLGPLIVSSKSDPELKCLTNKIADHLGVSIESKYWKKLSGDWKMFDRKNIPAINLHSVDRVTIRRIHHRRDKPGNVNLERLGETYRLAHHLIDQLAY